MFKLLEWSLVELEEQGSVPAPLKDFSHLGNKVVQKIL